MTDAKARLAERWDCSPELIDRATPAEVAWLEIPPPDHARAIVRSAAILAHYGFGEHLAGFADQASQIRQLAAMQ